MTIIYLLIFFFILVRLLRFLALTQQKEYRLDRLWSYFNTSAGLKDLIKIWPSLSDLTRTGLKRPVKTARILLVGLLTLALIFFLYLLVNFYLANLIFWLSTWVFLPLLVMVGVLPTAIWAYWWTWFNLKKASQIIAHKSPIVIGITGSFGKSSTKQLLAHLLEAKFTVFATPKSFNTKYSVARSINHSYSNQEIAILEYGAYSQGEIKTLAKYLPPSMAMITGFAPQHLDLFGSEENIIKAKRELILAMKKGSTVFANAQNKGVRQICQVDGYQIINYSGPDSQVVFSQVSLDQDGKLSFSWEGQKIKTELVGRHYLEIVAGAIAVCQYLGLTKQQIVDRLTSFKPSSNFITTSLTSKGSLIINDGLTTNPTGFKAALELIKEIQKEKKIILVTGGIIDLGQKEREIHLELAQVGSQFIDQVWYFGLVGKDQFKQIFGDRLIDEQNLIKEKISQLNQKDLVLLEGKQPLWLLKSLKI